MEKMPRRLREHPIDSPSGSTRSPLLTDSAYILHCEFHRGLVIEIIEFRALAKAIEEWSQIISCGFCPALVDEVQPQ